MTLFVICKRHVCSGGVLFVRRDFLIFLHKIRGKEHFENLTSALSVSTTRKIGQKLSFVTASSNNVPQGQFQNIIIINDLEVSIPTTTLQFILHHTLDIPRTILEEPQPVGNEMQVFTFGTPAHHHPMLVGTLGELLRRPCFADFAREQNG
mmetsp:Transcript_18318/g.18576  ORF Transcript_18318/g.18576 Transcript_18318/m.18576 type:complete len:151 (+) Transcript_18318:333-785(+)